MALAVSLSSTEGSVKVSKSGIRSYGLSPSPLDPKQSIAKWPKIEIKHHFIQLLRKKTPSYSTTFFSLFKLPGEQKYNSMSTCHCLSRISFLEIGIHKTIF